jgi:hypothetical protein
LDNVALAKAPTGFEPAVSSSWGLRELPDFPTVPMIFSKIKFILSPPCVNSKVYTQLWEYEPLAPGKNDLLISQSFVGLWRYHVVHLSQNLYFFLALTYYSKVLLWCYHPLHVDQMPVIIFIPFSPELTKFFPEQLIMPCDVCFHRLWDNSKPADGARLGWWLIQVAPWLYSSPHACASTFGFAFKLRLTCMFAPRATSYVLPDAQRHLAICIYALWLNFQVPQRHLCLFAHLSKSYYLLSYTIALQLLYINSLRFEFGKVYM